MLLDFDHLSDMRWHHFMYCSTSTNSSSVGVTIHAHPMPHLPHSGHHSRGAGRDARINEEVTVVSETVGPVIPTEDCCGFGSVQKLPSNGQWHLQGGCHITGCQGLAQALMTSQLSQSPADLEHIAEPLSRGD